MNSIHVRFLVFFFFAFFSVGKLVAQCPNAPVITNIFEDCNVTNENYTVSFELSGGDPSTYTVTPSVGVLSGNIFISNPIPSGQTYQFIANDAFNCEPDTLSGGFACDCISEAGSMETGTTFEICDGELVSLLYQGGSLLDANDVLQFILHTGPGVALGTILSSSSTPSIVFDPATMSYETTYYLSAVVGNDDGNGGVDLTDPCLDVSQGAPIIWHESPTCLFAVQNVPCNGLGGSLSVDCTGSGAPYSYLWSNGATGNTIGNLAVGNYSVTITSAFGCFTVLSGNVVDAQPMILSVTASGGNACAATTLYGNVFGGTAPYVYQWIGPDLMPIPNSNSLVLVATEPGGYFLSVTDANDCISVLNVEVETGTEPCGTITGLVTTESDGNCILDAGENGLENWLVRATGAGGDEYFGVTDSAGNYSILAALDDYTVEAIPPINFWDDCTGPVNLVLNDAADVDTADFHQFQVIDCPMMEVDISAPLLRRCFDNYYYVHYCNNGTQTATNAYVEVSLDPLVTIISSNFPFTGPVNGVYRFDVGDVEAGDCDGFNFIVQVSCDAVLGQTLCAEAHAYPDSLCAPLDPNWSGAFVEVTSTCTTDSVIFTITNTGTGDMDLPSYFIVVEDGVMLMTEEFQLPAGGSMTWSYAADGTSYTLVAEQVQGAPGFSNPVLSVEGCGTNSSGAFSMGFALQFPENDADPFVSIDCQEIIGSFDPNDKRGYPLGMGEEHIIEQGQGLDYHVRFQNTGTDTAFTVVIKDVITPSLDIATLRPGASSHPYQLDIHYDTLIFTFNDILLPDSNINEPGSHGFVKFSIGQKAGLPLGTVIENEAAIYFDFNDPVITNTSVHKLGKDFISAVEHSPIAPQKINCKLYPNPMGDEAVVLLQGAENQLVEMRLYDVAGRYLRSETILGGVGKIRKGSLAPGLYFYELLSNGWMVGQGKVAME